MSKWHYANGEAIFRVAQFEATVAKTKKGLFEMGVWDVKTQTLVGDPAEYPSEVGAKRAARHALRRLGAAHVEDVVVDTVPAPAKAAYQSCWTGREFVTVREGNGLRVCGAIRILDGVVEGEITLDGRVFREEYANELDAKMSVLKLADRLIDAHV